MNSHPSIDALVAHLDEASPSVASHLESCADCRSRSQRLANGLSIVEETRRASIPPLAWEHMEPTLEAEAARVAAEIRAGRMRPMRVVPTWVSGAFAMAAGAAVVLGVNAYLHTREAPAIGTVATHTVSRPVQAPYQGVVLLAAGGARYLASAAGEAVPLARVESLVEGAKVETPASARAVFTVRAGWTADLRSGSSVRLTQLRANETAVTLDHGDLALAPSAGETGSVRVVDGPYTVEANGSMLAHAEASVLRVVLLAGHADIRRTGGEALTVTGPLVVELPLDGSSPTQSATGVTDGDALDVSMFPATRSLVTLPPFDASATMTLVGHGALPSAIEVGRFPQGSVLLARVGHTDFRLDLSSTTEMRWTPIHAPAAVVALNTLAPHPRSVALPQAAPVDPGIVAFERTVPSRISHCFSTCFEQNRCRGLSSAQVRFAITPDGRGTVASLDPAADGARACLAHEAQFFHGPRTESGFDFQQTFRFGN